MVLSPDNWDLQITPAAIGRVEGARHKVLLPVFYEWLPEGSHDNSSQPCPSRSLTSSTSLQQKGMAYQLTQWGVISSHSLVAGPNISRKWDETVAADTSTWNSLSSYKKRRNTVNFWLCLRICVVNTAWLLHLVLPSINLKAQRTVDASRQVSIRMSTLI